MLFIALSVTLPAATSRRLLNLPQSSAVWVGGTCAFFAADDSAYCGAWLDTQNQTVRSMEVSEQPFSKQQLTRLLVQAMEHPQAKQGACRPQAIVVDDLELQFFLRGILLPLEIDVQYSKEIPLLEEFFAFMESQLVEEEEEEDFLPPEYAEIFPEKVKALAQLDLWRHFCYMQPLKLHCESWESPTLIALFVSREEEDAFGVMLYRGEEAFWQFWQRSLTEFDVEDEDIDDEEEDDPSLLDQDCLLLNFEGLDPFEVPAGAFFEMKGRPYSFDVGVVHPLEGIRHFFAPEEAEMVYVVVEALTRFWQRYGKRLRHNTYPELHMPLTIPSPLHFALTYKVHVSTDPEMLAQMHRDMAAKEQEQAERAQGENPIEITPIAANLYTIFRFETAESLAQLRQAVSSYQAGEVPKLERYPLLILQTTKSEADALARELADEGGVHHVTLLSDPQGVLGALVLLQTNANHVWLCQMLDMEALAEIEEWLQAVAAAEGACGLAIAYGMSGKTLRRPTLKQMVALYEVFLQPNYIDRDRPPTPQPIEHRS